MIDVVMLLLRDFIICTIAVMFYSILMNSPKRSIIYAALISGLGYVIFDISRYIANNEMLGYFIATLFIAVFGEVFARIKKMPSTIFIFPAIIPLVPGVGLYQTMLKLVQDEYEEALSKGVRTIFIAGTIAVAIAIINVLARYIIPRKK